MGLKVGTKYKLANKAKRNQQIIAYKEANPDATMRDMAEVFGISHVRIFAILNKAKSK